MGLSKQELTELRVLVDEVIYSRSKAEAKGPVRRLESRAAQLSSQLDSYLYGKLGEIIAYAKDASGQPRNKEHWIVCVEQCWYVFRTRSADDREVV
ncbi:MAG: hypothetical protein BroJett006_09400 [Betaproteobacteria bacterium]|nr:MAG: hypothetical protein BroJett006_09400 [Betaproteobacteria bacterium]